MDNTTHPTPLGDTIAVLAGAFVVVVLLVVL